MESKQQFFAFQNGNALKRISEEEHVRHCMRSILLTAPGERRSDAELGCGARELLYRPFIRSVLSDIQGRVTEALSKWEPRVEVDSVDVDPSSKGSGLVDLMLHYRIKGSSKRQSLQLEVRA